MERMGRIQADLIRLNPSHPFHPRSVLTEEWI
jgi:hypothetical protein